MIFNILKMKKLLLILICLFVSFEVDSKLKVGTILECKTSQNFMVSHNKIESLDEFHGTKYKISIIRWGAMEKETIWIRGKNSDMKYYNKISLREHSLYFQRLPEDPFGSDIRIQKFPRGDSFDSDTTYFFSTTSNQGNKVWVKHGECDLVNK